MLYGTMAQHLNQIDKDDDDEWCAACACVCVCLRQIIMGTILFWLFILLFHSLHLHYFVRHLIVACNVYRTSNVWTLLSPACLLYVSFGFCKDFEKKVRNVN